MRRLFVHVAVGVALVAWLPPAAPSAPAKAPGPILLDDRFELPPGFHVYRAAEPALAGGSYALTFDGDGQLLVGDGEAVRRLSDTDGDGVYDRFDVVATGLGRRGPQGLLVWGDRLYAVGGDGLQLFDGYRSGMLTRRGRLGASFKTGGDHDLHTVLRGSDGYLYLMAGNGAGAGAGGRQHITEASSPMLAEREASVFRVDPEGRRWECLAAGGRNPPGLGMSHDGELFSFDSDMEWHVGLPWYRPTQLNHWALGTDQGWQEQGAHPDWFIDSVEPVMPAGRGSPTWGVFYEHHQLPTPYHHAFLNCDYRWKRESNGEYASAGRLVAFFLERNGAGWQARLGNVARPKPEARDAHDRPIDFAVVDVTVGPDGSLFLTDHNQGVWRIFYAASPGLVTVPPIVPARPPVPSGVAALRSEVLSLPQPLSEWSRRREEELGAAGGPVLTNAVQELAGRPGVSVEERVRAVQFLAPTFIQMNPGWLRQLAADPEPEVRAQAAWLLGLRMQLPEVPLLLALLKDPHPLVRRRAAESLNRFDDPAVAPALVAALGDVSRLTRFVAMNALAHQPTNQWLELAVTNDRPQIRLRALVASRLRGEAPPADRVREILRPILHPKMGSVAGDDRTDLLRVLFLFAKSLANDPEARSLVEEHVLGRFPASVVPVRFEQARLIGEYRLERGFGPLVNWLIHERDPVTQFHLAQALARLPGGWTNATEEAALGWFESTQKGWFAEFDSKGVEFPQFWATTVSEFARRHAEALLRHAANIDVTSVLGSAQIEQLAARDPSGASLMALADGQSSLPARARLAAALGTVPGEPVAGWIRAQLGLARDTSLQAALLGSLARQPTNAANVPWLVRGLTNGDVEVVRLTAQALAQHQPPATRELARTCLNQASASARLVPSMERVLVAMSGQQRPGADPARDRSGPVSDAVRQAMFEFWKGWYRSTFGEEYQPAAPAGIERSDEDVLAFLRSEPAHGGSARRGAAVYERLQCQTCHGGGTAGGREARLFAPDLAGVTRRLSRIELTESLVYPSRQVPERFRTYEAEVKGGSMVTGVITAQSEDSVTLVDQLEVHVIARSQLVRLQARASSLMPERLLNRLSDDELRDLLAYLDRMGTPGD